MRSIRNICRDRGLLVTLAFIASLLEWIVIVRSENTEPSFMRIGTIPSNIKMPIGGNANITCHVFEDENSSRIWFYEKNFNETIKQPHKDIIIINDKTAVLTIRNATRHIFEYHCKIEKRSVGMTEVFVGSPPGKVEDFMCRSYDFKYMTCTFTRPQNLIYTTYELNYTNFPNKSCKETCMDLVEDGNKFTCNLTLRNDSFYVAIANIYYFNLTGINVLGKRSQIEIINQSNSVIPAKLDIQLENITTDSVLLAWQNYQYEYYVKITLDYEILLQPEGLKGYFATDYDYCNQRKCRVLINNLKYAHYNYSLRVRAKVKEAPNIDSMWSEPFIATFRTKAKKPDNPPETVPGSFYYMASHLYLYWQELKEYEHNGPGFHYIITEMGTTGNFINLTTTSSSMAVLQWNEHEQKERNYYIKAANNLGQSSNSTIKVYSDISNKQDFKLNFVVKVYENSKYSLSWKPPKKLQDLLNYTIFWCTEKIATINRCSGTIHFRVIDKSNTSYALESQNEPLNLAVSANYKDYSTGMNWACNADESALIELQPEAIALPDRSIKVFWSLDRICSSIIQGYNLTYCQTNRDDFLSNRSLKCISQPVTLQLNGELKNFTIKNIEPYSKYLINMLMYSRKKVGPRSDAILVETKEGAPSNPRNLTIVNLTSQSATISWLPPEKFNGKLKYYTICADSQESKLTLQLNASKTNSIENSDVPLNYVINDLKDFTKYTIYVIAHTVEPSLPSESVKIKTLIGKLNPPRIGVNFKEQREGILNFTEPLRPSGRFEFYEVALIVKSDNNKTVGKIVTTKNNYCRFRVPECHGLDFKYLLKVRAVYVANVSEIDQSILPQQALSTEPEIEIAESLYLQCKESKSVEMYSESLKTQPPNEIKLSSPWELAQGLVYNCHPVKISTFSSIAIIIIFIAILVTAYGGCKKFKKMNNIDVVLPPGLVDHLSAYKVNNNVGYGNKSEKDQLDLSRSNDCLVNSKENFHLLASLSSNSGNKPNGIIASVENTNENRRFNFERDYNHAFPREETSHGSYDEQNSSQSTDSVEINDMSSVSYSDGPLSNDIQLSNETPPPKIITTIPALNGYVSIDSATKSNTNTGYITADKINSFQANFLQEEESKKSVNDIKPNSSNNMYVTPAQLAQIGRSERLH